MIVLGLRAVFSFDGTGVRRVRHPPPRPHGCRGFGLLAAVRSRNERRFAQPLLTRKRLTEKAQIGALPECCQLSRVTK